MQNPYESQALLNEYLLFHYGSADEIMPWAFGPREALDFPLRTVFEMTDSTPRDRALDLGCAVGRSSFELSKFCREIIGIDFSRQFVEAAESIVPPEVSAIQAWRRRARPVRWWPADPREPNRGKSGLRREMPCNSGRISVILTSSMPRICFAVSASRCACFGGFPGWSGPAGHLLLPPPAPGWSSSRLPPFGHRGVHLTGLAVNFPRIFRFPEG